MTERKRDPKTEIKKRKHIKTKIKKRKHIKTKNLIDLHFMKLYEN